MEKPQVQTSADMGICALIQAVSMANLTWALGAMAFCGTPGYLAA